MPSSGSVLNQQFSRYCRSATYRTVAFRSAVLPAYAGEGMEDGWRKLGQAFPCWSGLVVRSSVLLGQVAEVWRPKWWKYPTDPAGRPWGPGRVVVGWTPCDCAAALGEAAACRGQGHLRVNCRTDGCTATWYKPRHGWQRQD